MVSELTFGFWREMLKARYQKHIWNKQFSQAFPLIAPGKERQDIYEHIDNAIKLRNRIAHHEPIVKSIIRHQPSNPKLIYEEILETISWVCPHTKDWVEHYCQFFQIYTNQP